MKIISVQVRFTHVIELQFKNDFGGVCMFGQGIYGCENWKGKGSVASPIYFLCKIEVSKFVTCL